MDRAVVYYGTHAQRRIEILGALVQFVVQFGYCVDQTSGVAITQDDGEAVASVFDAKYILMPGDPNMFQA